MVIQELPQDVQSLLRSGISIPSLSQAVIELILNSLDAGATSVAVYVDLKYYKIRVVDNGCGMSQHELDVLGKRYMTSKCHSIEDLKGNLCYFGFRGEALASIINISGVVTVTSRPYGSAQAYTKIFTHGKSHKSSLYHHKNFDTGTAVIVQDFMCKLPVRQKNTKESLDLEDIKSQLECIAVMHPHVSFSLYNDNKNCIILQKHKSSDLLSAFGHIYGHEIAQSLAPAVYSSDNFSISGYIGKKPSKYKNMQFIYVNKRVVIKTKIHQLINNMLAKSSILRANGPWRFKPIPEEMTSKNLLTLPKLERRNKFGIYIINLKCAFEEYDLHFDPKKTSVEFRDWKQVLSCVEKCVREFLHRESLVYDDKLETGSEKSPLKCLEAIEKETVETQSEENSVDNIPFTLHVSRALHGVPARRKMPLCEEKEPKILLTQEQKCCKTMNSESKALFLDKCNSSIQFTQKKSISKNSIEANISQLSSRNYPTLSNEFFAGSGKMSHETKVDEDSGITVQDWQKYSVTSELSDSKQSSFSLESEEKFETNRMDDSYSPDSHFSSHFSSDEQKNCTILQTHHNKQVSNLKNQNPTQSADEISHISEVEASKKVSFVNEIKKHLNPSHFDNNRNQARRYITNEDFVQTLDKKALKDREVINVKTKYADKSKMPLKNVASFVHPPFVVNKNVSCLSHCFTNPDMCERESKQAGNVEDNKINSQYFSACKTGVKSIDISTEDVLMSDRNEFSERIDASTDISEISKTSEYICSPYFVPKEETFPEVEDSKDIEHVNVEYIEPDIPSFNLLSPEKTQFHDCLVSCDSQASGSRKRTYSDKPSMSFGKRKKVQMINGCAEKSSAIGEGFIASDEECSEDLEVVESLPYVKQDTNHINFVTEIEELPDHPQVMAATGNTVTDEINTEVLQLCNSDSSDQLPTVEKGCGAKNSSNETLSLQPTVEASLDWSRQMTCDGKVFYVHKRSGMTSYNCPIEEADADMYLMTERYCFLPKGMSPILQNPTGIKNLLTPGAQQELHSALLREEELAENKWRDAVGHNNAGSKDLLKTLLVNAERKLKLYKRPIENAYDKKLSKLVTKVSQIMYPTAYTKSIFSNMKVVGQCDNKFIVVYCSFVDHKLPHIIGVFDQHAVHERIRLENLMNEYIEDTEINKFKSYEVEAAVVLNLSGKDFRIITSFVEEFERVGVHFEIVDKNIIKIKKVPTCLYRREMRENSRKSSSLKHFLQCLISDQVEVLQQTHGASCGVPNVLQEVINYEACRGAIKFGDALEVEECSTLIKNLALCKQPFMCAHGRPTFGAIYDMEQMYNNIKLPVNKFRMNI